nr:uncharacterized protein LOC109150431 [Ipomoea batatas]
MDKPPTGLTKVNVDATLNHNGRRMGFGFVLRDSTGLFVVAKEVPWNALFKPREAEAVGVREPIKWLKDIHVDDVQRIAIPPRRPQLVSENPPFVELQFMGYPLNCNSMLWGKGK